MTDAERIARWFRVADRADQSYPENVAIHLKDAALRCEQLSQENVKLRMVAEAARLDAEPCPCCDGGNPHVICTCTDWPRLPKALAALETP